VTFRAGGRSAGAPDGRRTRGATGSGDLVAGTPQHGPEAAPPAPADAPMTATYVKVLLVEAVTLAALWVFQVVFGGP
jgi:hypothetical protein